MARKIKAGVVEQFGKPLTLRQRDIPSPAAGKILVKTEACLGARQEPLFGRPCQLVSNVGGKKA